MKQTVIAFLLLACALAASAQEAPVVRVDVTPKEIAVGEPVRLRVLVLGPTWFPSAPEFPSFEISNAIVRLPPDSSRAYSERIGRDMWSGVVRNYLIYPLLGANYRLDELTMHVTYANPGSANITVDLDIPPIEFRAVVPNGAGGLEPYIAGRELVLTRTLEGEPEVLKAGDAMVVNYTAELDGLPAIFLPTLFKESETVGASIYVDAPVVEDGSLARRSEKVTYVFEAGGDFVLPAAQLRWWNTETSTIEVASVAPLTLSVVGPPVMQESTAQLESARNLWSMLGGILVLFVALILTVTHTSVLRDRWREQRKQKMASEAHVFNHLKMVLRSGEPRAAYKALVTWLEHVDSAGGMRQLVSMYGSTELYQDIETLSQTLYSDVAETIDFRRLERELVAARRNHKRELKQHVHAALPPLNP